MQNPAQNALLECCHWRFGTPGNRDFRVVWHCSAKVPFRRKNRIFGPAQAVFASAQPTPGSLRFRFRRIVVPTGIRILVVPMMVAVPPMPPILIWVPIIPVARVVLAIIIRSLVSRADVNAKAFICLRLGWRHSDQAEPCQSQRKNLFIRIVRMSAHSEIASHARIRALPEAFASWPMIWGNAPLSPPAPRPEAEHRDVDNPLIYEITTTTSDLENSDLSLLLGRVIHWKRP